MERAAFEQLITDALLTIPDRIRGRLSNVAFLVEDEARKAEHDEAPIRHGMVLLGLYKGIPLIRRDSNYTFVLPDTITLFQRTIEQIAGDDELRVRDIVHDTVLHEVAHHLGFTEREVRAWERRRKHRQKPL